MRNSPGHDRRPLPTLKHDEYAGAAESWQVVLVRQWRVAWFMRPTSDTSTCGLDPWHSLQLGLSCHKLFTCYCVSPSLLAVTV